VPAFCVFQTSRRSFAVSANDAPLDSMVALLRVAKAQQVAGHGNQPRLLSPVRPQPKAVEGMPVENVASLGSGMEYGLEYGPASVTQVFAPCCDTHLS
jgi:hypothetical protein